MIYFNYIKNLEQIARENKIILIDNSAITGFFSKCNEGIVYEDVEEMGEFIIKLGNRLPLFTTTELYQEAMSGIRENIKKKERKKKYNICKKIKKRNLRIFDSLKVLELTETELELYSYFYKAIEKYSSSLSEPDMDLLISGIILTQTRGNCAILSNDLGIFETLWSSTSNRNGLSYKNKIHFYIRGENVFNEMKI